MCWWCTDTLILHWWCNDYTLVICWWCTDNALMMWWCADDGLMMRWWCADDARIMCLMMGRRCTKNALTMRWWCTDTLINGFMTPNQIRVTLLCHGVTEILTRHGMSKMDFEPDFRNPQMHSFPNMYNTMGSKMNGFAVREHFLSKNVEKTAFFGLTILDQLTLERSSTHNFRDWDLSRMCFGKFGTWAFRWAMGRPSSIKIVRLAAIWNFSWGGNGKLQKTAFFAKNPSPRYFLMGKFFQDRTMWNCESSLPEASENVVLFGRRIFLTGVIAAQSQHRAAKVCLSRKISDVKKKGKGLKKFFSSKSSWEKFLNTI